MTQPWLKPKLGARLIILDGNIGVGKTTFVKPFAKRNGYYLITEPVTGNPYLGKFYADPGKHAYTMETWFLNERITAYLKALDLINEGKNVIIERSHFSCLVFTKNCWRNKWITDEQFRDYSEVFHKLNSLLPTPDVLIFLEASVETCHNRMVKRDRKCEAGVTREYLEWISRYMGEMVTLLRETGTKIMVLNWENFSPGEMGLANTLNETPSGFHGWSARVGGKDVYIPEIIEKVNQVNQVNQVSGGF